MDGLQEEFQRGTMGYEPIDSVGEFDADLEESDKRYFDEGRFDRGSKFGVSQLAV